MSQYFPPEMGAPSARVHELSRAWRQAGHDVTVLTAFAHHPTGVKAPGDRFRLTRRTSLDGIDVVRAYIYAAPNRGTWRRMASYLSFFVAATVIGLVRVRRPDVIVATSPQLLAACAGYLLARRFRVPFVFEVRDLWPESIVAVDAMHENVVIRALRRVAAHLYAHSARIVTVGEGYKRQIVSRYAVPAERLTVVPNGIDPQFFTPAPRDNDVRRELGWGDRLVVLYVGTLGMAHALHVVLEAAARLAGEPDKLFVFVGEGARKDELKRQAGEQGLCNVQFIDHQPKERIPAYYAACDLGLVTLRNTPLFQDVLPSKIFEYLGMERPVLVAVDGEARRLVEAAGAGRFVPPEDPRALADAIRELARDRVRLAAMGRAGRLHVVEHYDRRMLARRYAELLEQLVSLSRAGRGA